MKKSTNCVHFKNSDQGVNTPIFTSTANKYLGYDQVIYPRYFNTDNQEIIAEKLAELEGGEAGMVFSSGMAAISTALFSNLSSGDHVLISSEIYGGTHKLIVEEFQKFGISYEFFSGSDLAGLERLIKKNTKIIYTETPSNPLLTIVDLKAVADIAKNHNIITLVDNTFASPINQNPITLGFDIAIHSGTKYLGGHSDLCFGAVICTKAMKGKLLKSALNFGGSLNALDCYLIERSLKTLAVRVTKQNDNAMKIAAFLHSHPKIKKVHYPGLLDHPGHDIAKKQMPGGFGGMLSFELSDKEKSEAFLQKLQIIPVAVSLGGVETIICQPSRTSHVKMPEVERLKIGITDALLRLSVGIEDAEDLVKELNSALQ